MEDHINYAKILDNAMRQIVVSVLKIIKKHGLSGDHHLFISFDTRAHGVRLSERMKAKYPEEITIVLQYQFEDLVINDDAFSVTLHFDGIQEVVVVPYSALTAFSDPSVRFSLQFTSEEDIALASSDPNSEAVIQEISNASDLDNVIVLDKFRK